MITDLHHTALFVSDLDRSLEFYVETLGFELVAHDHERGGAWLEEVCGGVDDLRLGLALVRAGGEIIELIEILSPDSIPSDATARRFGVARLGVEFMSEIVTVTAPAGQHYSDGRAIFFRDPDGIILELQQPPALGRIT